MTMSILLLSYRLSSAPVIDLINSNQTDKEIGFHIKAISSILPM